MTDRIDDDEDDPFYHYQSPRIPRPPPPPKVPEWQEHLTAVQQELAKKPPTSAWPREFELLYAIDVAASKLTASIVVEMLSRTRKKNGEWSAPKGFKVTPAQAVSLPDAADAEVVAAMLGGQEYFPYGIILAAPRLRVKRFRGRLL